MNAHSMIYQLLQNAGKTGTFETGKVELEPERIILNTEMLDAIEKQMTVKSCALPTLIVHNRLPLSGGADPATIERLKECGVQYYPPGRTGMPAMVAAEDGLAVPGGILVTNDKNLLELGVLGTYVVKTDAVSIASLMNTGSIVIPVPETFSIILSNKPGEWTGGVDIALYILKYFDLPKDPATVLEIYGEGLANLPLEERHNLARVLIDLGYEHVLFQVDDAVVAFLQDRTEALAHYYFPEDDTRQDRSIHIEMQKIHPMLAWKENDEIMIGSLTDKDGQPVEQVFIGGDTACRYLDVEAGLRLTRYRPLAESVSACLMPGSQLVNSDILDMGIAGILGEIGFELLPSSFLEQAAENPDRERQRIGTSVSILRSGGMLAGAMGCFSAAMTGRITHPLELESLLKQEENHNHDHDTEE